MESIREQPLFTDPFFNSGPLSQNVASSFCPSLWASVGGATTSIGQAFDISILRALGSGDVCSNVSPLKVT